MRIYNVIVLNQTASADVSSEEETLEHIFGFSVQAAIEVVSAVTGCVAKVQVTNDNASNHNSTPTWSDLDAGQAVSASGVFNFNYPDIFYRFIRFTVTLASGQINVVATLNAKGF